jgi:hypothetical protein
MYEDEYKVSYDFRDYEAEERSEWIPAEIEEYSQLDKEAFIKKVENDTRKYGIRKWPSDPKSEPRDLTDGLKEWIESKAGRPISELHDRNGGNDNVDVKKLVEELEADTDKMIEDMLNDPAYRENLLKEADERSARIPMYDFGLGKMSNEKEMLDFYGLDIVRRIREEREESHRLPKHIRKVGQISEKLWQELRDIRAGSLPHPKAGG